jgi:hypothetical protein
MRKLGFVSAFLVCALGTLAAACGDDDGDDGGPGGGSGDATFSCTTSGENGCIEYRGSQQPLDAMRDACTAGDGTPGTQCSRSGAQGGCTMGSAQAFVRTIYYEMDAEELDTVKQICASSQNNVWSDTP